jgi:hypothetical protein
MRSGVRTLVVLLLAAPALAAQRQQASAPALPPLSDAAAAALDELAPRYAGESELIQGWFRDRVVLYYNFGALARPVTAGRVLWPIHGFDARGNPVAMRGQRPIFASIPGLPGYSGLWRLTYVVVADKVQPNELRTTDDVEQAVRRRRAALRETPLTLNLPIVPRGQRLARDSTPPMLGWFQGREVQFFDFGAVSEVPAPMWRFATGVDADGEPVLLEAQNGLLDSIPVVPTYPDLWDIRIVRVDSTYAPNTIKSAAALRATTYPVDSARVVRNLPVVIVDGARVARVPSPLTEFADLRSPFPPAFTRPPD